MASAKVPLVLLVDDDEAEMVPYQNALNGTERIRVEFSSPETIDFDMVKEAALVLVDQELGLAEEEKKKPYSEWIPDGVALAASLRRHLARTQGQHSPTAFALLSSELRDLAAPLPVTSALPQLARHNNLEWVFDKTDSNRHLYVQIPSLAEAVHRIPRTWEDGIQGLEELRAVLGLVGDLGDADECWEVIERCHPPVYEITQWTHGLAFVRWLLLSVLSYPCFLWDERRVAARFRVGVREFRAALDDSNSLRDWLSGACYTGMLADFDGRRWWGHRIERLAWRETEGDSQNAELLRAKVAEKAGRELAPTEAELPIVCIDKDFRSIDPTFNFDDAVRVKPDGWPAYAAAAWMPREVISENQNLRSLVIPDDLSRL